MTCQYSKICGGCSYNNMDNLSYKQEKISKFTNLLGHINQADISLSETIFIPTATRRRTSFAFTYKKGFLTFGFNEKATHNLIDISSCLLLTAKINNNINNIKSLLTELCKNAIVERIKKGKTKTSFITSGDAFITEADNGLDIVLDIKENLGLEHKLIISEHLHNNTDFIRISHRQDITKDAEIIAEKAKPIIDIADYNIYISPGTFLQPSKQGEQALVDLVMKYIGTTEGKIADLFCGIGTFSYPLAKNIKNKITSIDSSSSLLDGFKTSINKNMITNIEPVKKNLFKYPLNDSELKNFDAIVIDPPRAGAHAQMEQIKETGKIVAISCNPSSFIKDANTLISNGYNLDEITFVDQFIYSNHIELVAMFTKTK